jgi:putative addiction module component (TIGR02574 family)
MIDGDLEQTISALSKLSVDERLLIVHRLWDSIPSDADVAITAEQRTELARRIAAHDANPSSAISQQELEQRLRDVNR